MAIFVLGNLTNVVQENIMAFRKVDAIVTKIFTKLGARIPRSLGIFFRGIRQFHVPWGRLSL